MPSEEPSRPYNWRPKSLAKLKSNNIALADVLGYSLEDICLDLYGNRPNEFNKRYYLTVKRMPFKVLKTFGLYMRPQGLNVFENIPGNDILLYDTTEKASKPKRKGIQNRLLYYLHGYSYKLLPLACWVQMKVLVRKAWRRYIAK